jgi:hypothetical protein
MSPARRDLGGSGHLIDATQFKMIDDQKDFKADETIRQLGLWKKDM